MNLAGIDVGAAEHLRPDARHQRFVVRETAMDADSGQFLHVVTHAFELATKEAPATLCCAGDLPRKHAPHVRELVADEGSTPPARVLVCVVHRRSADAEGN
jgi:hypothetical protein